MLKLIFIFLVIFSLLIFISCDKTISPEPDEPSPFFNTVVFDSKPKGFTVFINGKVTGAVTPDSLRSLDLGISTVRLSKPLYRDSVFTLNIENYDEINLFFDIHANPLMLGSIQVNSTPPGATIFFNGDSTEFLTPHKFTNLIPGDYEIYLKKESHWDFYYPLTVLSNTTPVINATLEDTSVWVIYNEKNIKHKINYTNTIAIDENGYVWVGSVESGLYKYDGNSWTNYNTENSNIPDNSIRDIETEGSKVWIATNGGVTLFHNEIFTTFNENNSPLPSDLVYKIYVHNGKKYIATFARGIAVFDDVNWVVYNTNNSGLKSDLVRAFSADNDNNIWIGTAELGLMKLDGTVWTWYDLKAINDNISYNVTAISLKHNGFLYIALGQPPPLSWGSPGLLIYNGTNFTFYRNNPEGIIRTILFYQQSNGWFATSFGAYKESTHINYYIHFNILNSRLPANDIRDLAIDQQGNKWFATFGGGVVKYKGD